MSIELVTWRDAHFSFDDDRDDDDFLVQTVGWTSEDGRFLRIESEHVPDGARAVTRVPLENVMKREQLMITPNTVTSISYTNEGGTA